MKEEIGLRIKEIRENMNLTKEDFAKLLGITGQYLGLVEKGKNTLSVEKLKTLCDITNLPADYILFGKNPYATIDTKELLNEFTLEQIETGCSMLKDLALFLKNI